MKNKRIVNMGIILVLVTVMVWSMLGLMRLREEDTYYYVSVILNDSYNESWTLARNGMEQAAKDNNIILNYLYTNSMESAEEQMDLIRREEKNGAQGIITKLLPLQGQEQVEELTGKDNLILMDCLLTDSETQSNAYVGPDYYTMGKSLAHRVYQDHAKEGADGDQPSSDLRIGLILRQDEVASQQGKRGFLEAADELGMTVSWIMESELGTQEGEKLYDRINEKKQVDVLVTLENTLSECAVDYVERPDAKSAGADLYGIGFSEKLIFYLDRGRIRALAVPNEFNLGYQSVQAMAEKLTAKQTTAGSNEIRFTLVDKTTLYDEDNQKMLFPIVQ